MCAAGSKLYVDVDEVVGKAAAALKGTKGTKFGGKWVAVPCAKHVLALRPAAGIGTLFCYAAHRHSHQPWSSHAALHTQRQIYDLASQPLTHPLAPSHC